MKIFRKKTLIWVVGIVLMGLVGLHIMNMYKENFAVFGYHPIIKYPKKTVPPGPSAPSVPAAPPNCSEAEEKVITNCLKLGENIINDDECRNYGSTYMDVFEEQVKCTEKQSEYKAWEKKYKR